MHFVFIMQYFINNLSILKFKFFVSKNVFLLFFIADKIVKTYFFFKLNDQFFAK